MRTTLDITDELLRRAKRKAADEHMSLKSVVEAALREYLSGTSAKGEYRFQLKVHKASLQPGVDIDDRDSLYDIMDGLK